MTRVLVADDHQLLRQALRARSRIRASTSSPKPATAKRQFDSSRSTAPTSW